MARIAARISNWLSRDAKRLSEIASEGKALVCLVTLRGPRIVTIRPRTPAAAALTGQDWAEAVLQLGIDPDAIGDQVLALAHHGVAFRCCAESDAFGLVSVTGWTERLEAHIALSRCSPLEQDLHEQLQRSLGMLDTLQDAGARAESSPVPAIETDGTGRIVWHNAAAERLLRRGINRVALAQIEPGARGSRTQLLGSDGQVIGWARATSALVSGGGKIVHLEDIDAQIQAESDLDSFMSTLTETFAHLEQGLGIFDRERKLTLFNPALAQMFGLDPGLLAGRPSLRHFLEALRQRRMVPEQRDYTEWRTRFIEASSATGAAPYTQDWPLPSGRTLQVSVRRHPRGALAFIFKDISDQVMLETRYRSEIETTQATLEKLAQAVAVFGASGQITYANPAFAQVLGCDAMDSLIGESIDDVCEAARAAFRSLCNWEAVRRYILSSERDGAWHAVDEYRSGCKALLRACALPDGSTLLTLDTSRAEAVSAAEAERVRA